MMAIPSALRRNASPHATAIADSMLGAATTPGAENNAFRLTTILVRPLSGLPIERNVFRPITTGLPMVAARNICISDLSRQGKRPARPITPLSATAAIKIVSIILRFLLDILNRCTCRQHKFPVLLFAMRQEQRERRE